MAKEDSEKRGQDGMISLQTEKWSGAEREVCIFRKFLGYPVKIQEEYPGQYLRAFRCYRMSRH